MEVNIPKLIRRVASLFNLSQDQAGTPEGDNAQVMMHRLLDKKGIVLPEGGLDFHEETIEQKNDWDLDLGHIIGLATHITAHQLTDKTPHRIRFRGSKVLVDEATKHFREQREQIERLSAFVSVGYLAGAFGTDLFLQYLEDASNVSATVETGLKENEARAKARDKMKDDPTKREQDTITAATQVGMANAVKFWKDLKEPPDGN